MKLHDYLVQVAEGGNVEVDGLTATPFNANTVDPKLFWKQFKELLNKLDVKYKLWDNGGRYYYSGSTRFLFSALNRLRMFSKVAAAVKKLKSEYGDVDLKVPSAKKDDVLRYFPEGPGGADSLRQGQEFVLSDGTVVTYLGAKHSADTVITLWNWPLRTVSGEVVDSRPQVDLELVPFESDNSRPLPYTTLLLSSSLRDLQESIKGFAHKLLLEVLVSKKKVYLNTVTKFNKASLSLEKELELGNVEHSLFHLVVAKGVRLNVVSVSKFVSFLKKYSNVQLVELALQKLSSLPSSAVLSYSDVERFLSYKEVNLKSELTKLFPYFRSTKKLKKFMGLRQGVGFLKLSSFVGLVDELVKQKLTLVERQKVFVHFFIKLAQRKLFSSANKGSYNSGAQRSVETKKVPLNYLNTKLSLNLSDVQFLELTKEENLEPQRFNLRKTLLTLKSYFPLAVAVEEYEEESERTVTTLKNKQTTTLK